MSVIRIKARTSRNVCKTPYALPGPAKAPPLPDNKGKLASMKKLLVIIPSLLAALLAGGYLYANIRVKSLVDERIAGFVDSGQYQLLEYEDVALTHRGDIHLQSLHVIDAAGNDYVLDEIRVSNFDYFNPTPHHLQLTATGLRFPNGMPMLGNTTRPALDSYIGTRMNENTLPLEIHYQYDFVPEDQARLDSALSISLPASFRLSTSTIMHNIALDEINQYSDNLSPTPAPYTTLLARADIPSASIALQDQGLVRDMLAIQGQGLGMNADEYREQLLAQLQTMLLFTPRQLQTLAMDFLTRLSEFLEGGKTLQVSVTPEFGGNMQQLQGEILGAFYIGNFPRIIEVLNLEVETLP